MTFASGQRVTAAQLNNTTLELLQATQLTSPSASVVLNVPTGSSFNHLVVKWHARGDAAVVTQQMKLQFNGISTNSYLSQKMEANNATQTDAIALQTFIQIGTIPGASATALYFAGGEININGNSDTVNYIPVVGTCVCFSASNNGFAAVYAGMSANVGAITSVTLLPNAGNFIAGSAFSLLASA